MEPDALDGLWPLRTRPCQGELFSSWLVRVARCYDMPVQKFCREVWPEREIWRGDIDRRIDDEALHLLSSKTGVPYPELFLTTLRAHEQYAGASPEDEYGPDLYFHFGNNDHAIRFCPVCIGERQPYYRLEWRLAFVTVCAKHRVPLAEKCQFCKAPCLFANVAVDERFGSCHRCHRSLTYALKEVRNDMALQMELHVEFQQNVLNVLRKGQPVR